MSGVDPAHVVADVAKIRSDKARVTASVASLAHKNDIRLLTAGGSVFVAQGLISPWVWRFVTVIVDPERFHDFVRVVMESGWTLIPPAKGSASLPTATVKFSSRDWTVDLHVFAAFPGFYAAPQDVFNLLWTGRQGMQIHDTPVHAVDRLVTIMLSVHDRLGEKPNSLRAQSNKTFLLAQYRSTLTPEDKSRLSALTTELGAGEPMRPLFVALGIDPGEIVLPPESYAKWRLGLPTVGPATIALLALLECPSKSRMIRTWRVLRQSPSTVIRAVFGLPRAVWLLTGTPQRLWNEFLADQGLTANGIDR
jgi:hypothetical protein